uniref:Transporter n=1 Tax=Eptatretus burgeri TaxID=7764 RepID=A0A8C4RA81_EPTBU
MMEILKDKETSAEEKPNARYERPQWGSKVQYFLTMVGYVVGIGNFWRFPYLCQTYGGGAFLIPYFIALFIEGLPVFFLELAIAQRLRKGSLGVWSTIHPCLTGIGYSSLVLSFFLCLYFSVIITWIVWYLLHSFEYPLPWGFCPINENHTEYLSECRISSSVNYFWYRKTLDISANINEGGTVRWWLVICHIFVWSITYCCTSRGIESTGKVVYITTPIPYIILFCFLVQSLTLEGSSDGLRYMFTPDMTQLQNPKVWMDAATQIFYSVGLGFGAVMAFSSYNNIHNNCEGDAVFLSLVNSFTSIFIAIPIFSILGFKANLLFNNAWTRMCSL